MIELVARSERQRATSSRRGPRLLAAGALAVAAVVGHAGPGHAATAVEAGWWTASPLVAPDAPPDALVVEGGVDGALAYGAVRYTLAPDEVPESLTVHLAPGAASTPSTTLALCPVTELFTPVQGGPMADAPAYDCEIAVEAAPSADGASYRFDVAGLVRDGAVAVALLPTAPTDRVVLTSPGADSLATGDAAVATPGAGRPPAGEATSDRDVAGPTAPATSGSSGAARAPRPVVSAPAVPSRPTPEAAAAPPRAAPASVAAAPAAQDGDPSRSSSVPPALFVGLAVVAALLWRGRGAGDDVVSAPA
jgi:hypothetical protein